MKLRAFSLCLGLILAAVLPGRAQPQVAVTTYTLELRPGWNAIANPLDVGSNRVSELFPNLPDGTLLAKFNSATGGYELNQVDQGVWVIDTGFASVLRPGEGAFLLLPAGRPTVQLAISGVRHDAAPLTNAALPGFNLVACQSIEPCTFEQLMGFAPQTGDAVYFYETNLPPQLPNPPGPGVASRVSHFGTNGWDTAPIIDPLQAVFVELANRPRLTVVPPRQRAAVGATARFTAIPMGGQQPTAFRWRFNGTLLTNESSRTLTLSNAQPASAGNYVVEADFPSPTGTLTSLVARLSVFFPPVITEPPESITVVQGATATFKVGAGGSSPFTYQWYFNGSPLTGAQGMGSVLTIANAQPAHSGNYRVVVSNPVGSITSQVATLTVFMPPQILIQPVSQTASPNGTVILSVFAVGSQPLMFQWLLNGNPIPGAIGQMSMLTITNFQPEQAGSYRVIVTNPAGAVQSQAAEVRLNLTPSGLTDQFFNASTLSAPVGLIRGGNANATLEVNEPPHAGHVGGRSMWVNYRSTNGGIATFHTKGSSFDTLLAAYVGDALGNLVEVGSDDDRGGFLTSEITFNIMTNVIYRIVVDGLDAEAGDILLSWRFQPTTNQVPIITLQPKGQSAVAGQSVAFSVMATGTSRYQWLFNGQPIPNATTETLVVTNVQPSDVGAYSVQVVNNTGTLTNFSRAADLDLREIDGPGQPSVKAYDKLQDLIAALAGRPPDFQPAVQVLGYTGSQTFSTVGSGGQNGEPVHCGASGGHSKWYSYITPTNGTLFLNTDGSNFDTLLAVYTGCCTFSSLTPVACDNNSGTNGLASSLSFPATANTLYFIAVDGVGGTSGLAKLNYRLLVPMMLTNLSSTTNSLTFSFNVTPSWPYAVQRSSNCLDWLTLFTSNSAVSPLVFTDTNLPAGRRFYRSMQVP